MNQKNDRMILHIPGFQSQQPIPSAGEAEIFRLVKADLP
jgi:hypothetical protein